MSPAPTSAATSKKLRLANLVFWLGMWAGVVWWTEASGQWMIMTLESVIPIMLGLMFHIVFRPHGEAG